MKTVGLVESHSGGRAKEQQRLKNKEKKLKRADEGSIKGKGYEAFKLRKEHLKLRNNEFKRKRNGGGKPPPSILQGGIVVDPMSIGKGIESCGRITAIALVMVGLGLGSAYCLWKLIRIKLRKIKRG